MDLDDFDDLGLGNAPVKPPPRASKFLPKSAKLIPKQEPQPNLPKPSKNPHQQDLDAAMDEPQEPPAPEPSLPTLDDDQEDRVVRELDVFVAPRLDRAELYVLQCPLRPLWRPYEFGEKCEEVRVNPKEGLLEVDLLLDTEGNYDHDAPDRLQIKKQRLLSRKAPLETSYAVGVLRGNGLYLNSVDAVLQLRPSMEHLTPQGLKSAVNLDEINGVKDSGSAKKQGKTKTVKAAGAGAGASTSEVAEVVEESWVSLEYHGMDSFESGDYQKKMTLQESSEIQFSMKPSDYIKSLCPASAGAQNQDGSASNKSLLSMPLEARLKKWLFDGPQLKRFSAVMHLAPKESSEDVLEILQQHAWLVQGLWVPRSSTANAKSAVHRDFVIGLFQKNTVVRCSDFTKLDVYQNIQKEAEHHLSTLAVYKPSSASWELKEPKDKSFILSHPDIVKKQEEKWAMQEKKLMEALKRPKMDRSSLRKGSKGTPK